MVMRRRAGGLPEHGEATAVEEVYNEGLDNSEEQELEDIMTTAETTHPPESHSVEEELEAEGAELCDGEEDVSHEADEEAIPTVAEIEGQDCIGFTGNSVDEEQEERG